MNDRLTYDYRPVANKLKIIHTRNKPDASDHIRSLLASEFQNLPIDIKIEMAQIALDAADVPYEACSARWFNPDTNMDTDNSKNFLHIISKMDLDRV